MGKFKIGDQVRVSEDSSGISGWDGRVVDFCESMYKVDFGVMRLWMEDGKIEASE